MLPVSLIEQEQVSLGIPRKKGAPYGAEQLHDSAATLLRPMTSAITEYSRFVRSVPTLCVGHAISLSIDRRMRLSSLWVVRLGKEEIPQSELLRLGLQFFQDRRNRLPALLGVSRDLSVPDAVGGDALLVDELDECCELLLCILREAAEGE